MLAHTRSVFTTCSGLFARYPLAVTWHYAGRAYRSMVLLNRAAGPAGFFVLTQVSEDMFVIRSWHRQDMVNHAIRPDEPVSEVVDRVISESMPIPHDGALLGWVTDKQVTVMLAAHCREPSTWTDPAPVPEIRVMPMAGTSELLHWPPFTVTPLDGQLWQYVELGQIVDIGPLLTNGVGRAYWVPSPDRRSARHPEGCVVVQHNLPADDFWLPAGVYMDHWVLREGIPAPPAGRLLGLPGVMDMADKLGV